MAIKLDILGGSNWVDGQVLYASDLNNTIGSAYEYTANNQLINQTKILKSNGVYANEYGVFAENFTVYNGVNNTLISGTSYTNAIFAGSGYTNISDLGSSTQSESTVFGTFLNVITYSGKINRSTGYFSQFFTYTGSTSAAGSGFLNVYQLQNGNVIGSVGQWCAGNGANYTFTFNPTTNFGNGSLFTSGDTFQIILSGTSSYGFARPNALKNISGLYFSGPAAYINHYNAASIQFTFKERINAGSSTKVTCGSNLFLYTGSQNNLKLFVDATIPVGAEITADLICSGVTISGILFTDNVCNFRNISNLGLGSMAIQFNLNYSGTNPPFLKGFSGMVQK
jgi:hypothetical protein